VANKKSALTSRFSDIISTAPESTTPDTQTAIQPQYHMDGETIKNTWVVKKSTVLALKRLAMERFAETGKRVAEGTLIDEAIEAYIRNK
jgi:hypothetical protein